MLMEALQIRRQPLPTDLHLMNSISGKFRATIGLTSAKLRCFCASSSPNSTSTKQQLTRRKSVLTSNGKVRANVSDAQLKENWLHSLSCPFPENLFPLNGEVVNVCQSNSDSNWVIGIDPDVSGALALLKTDHLGCSAQVFDSPHLKVLVGKRIRRRLDAKSIVQLLKSFDAPVGTTAYVEQSIPFPQDGKQDDSREAASTLFPSMSSLLKRKKDHGRAEALLIAAYGKGMKISTNSSSLSEELMS
ncbi:hypothetical protein CsSME_00042197 [Camellia sinensis var. sinensis]